MCFRYAMINSLYADAIEAANATAAAVARELSHRSWAWASYCMDDEGALPVSIVTIGARNTQDMKLEACAFHACGRACRCNSWGWSSRIPHMVYGYDGGGRRHAGYDGCGTKSVDLLSKIM